MALIIIKDELVNPPSWSASFRDLTLYCVVFYQAEVILETPNPDLYWRWLRRFGGMDFISDLVPYGRENGVRLDIAQLYPRTVVTDRIAPENCHYLLGRIKGLL